MRREHRRPMTAFVLVAIACAVMVGNATRNDTGDLGRPERPSLVAGGVTTPPSTVGPSPSGAAEVPVTPVAGRTLTRRSAPRTPTPAPVVAPTQAVPAVDTDSVTSGAPAPSGPQPDRAGGRRHTHAGTAWARHHRHRGAHSGPRGEWFTGHWPGHWSSGHGSNGHGDSDHDGDDGSRHD